MDEKGLGECESVALSKFLFSVQNICRTRSSEDIQNKPLLNESEGGVSDTVPMQSEHLSLNLYHIHGLQFFGDLRCRSLLLTVTDSATTVDQSVDREQFL